MKSYAQPVGMDLRGFWGGGQNRESGPEGEI